MRISENGIEFIRQLEGEKLTAYPDIVGIWTIGVASTKEKSKELLTADLKRFESAVNDAVKVTITQNQFDALVSLAFNIGEGAFARSTLVNKLNAGDKKGAAEQFLVWKNAGGRVSQGLLNRRQKEKAMFEVV